MFRLFALVAAAALLGGCAQPPGTAAVVNGERITEQQVAAASETFAALLGSVPSGAAIVDALVKEAVVTPVAANYGLTASDADVVQYLGEYAIATGTEPLAAEDYTAAGLLAGRYLVLMGEAQGSPNADVIITDVLTAFRTAEIEVSPRYGDYDENGQLLPVVQPWTTATQ